MNHVPEQRDEAGRHIDARAVLSILFFLIHLVDDIIRGFEEEEWALRVTGSHRPHEGRGLGVASITGSSGGFFFVFTTIAIGVTALFSFILAAQGLWSLRRGRRGLNER